VEKIKQRETKTNIQNNVTNNKTTERCVKTATTGSKRNISKTKYAKKTDNGTTPERIKYD
jgi:hypothetical protein